MKDDRSETIDTGTIDARLRQSASHALGLGSRGDRQHPDPRDVRVLELGVLTQTGNVEDTTERFCIEGGEEHGLGGSVGDVSQGFEVVVTEVA